VDELTINVELWKFINTFAPWLSAFGTICAVILSLHLARRDKTIRLEVSAGHRLRVAPGTPGPYREYVVIKIVNIGHREAQITGVGWKIGFFRRQWAFHITNNDGMSSNIPIRLKDGEEANYYIPLNKINWLQNFAQDFLKSFPTIRSRFIKVAVSTSVGKWFEERIETSLRKMLVTAAKKMPSN
jgi:hypothetical protein